MTFTGQVVGGQIVLAAPLPLPDGTTVKVEAVAAEPPTAPSGDRPGTMLERYRGVIGKVELPSDAEDIFAEMAPLMVDVRDVDDSRETIYSPTGGE